MLRNLDDIMRDADAATREPWVMRNEYDEKADVWFSGSGVSPYVLADRIDRPDARFIAAARTDIPELVGRVRELAEALLDRNGTIDRLNEAVRVRDDRITQLETVLRDALAGKANARAARVLLDTRKDTE